MNYSYRSPNTNSRQGSFSWRQNSPIYPYGSPGFIPLPHSPSPARHSSPFHKGNDRRSWHGNRMSSDRQCQSWSPASQPIRNYFKPSMLEDPWMQFSPPALVNNAVKNAPSGGGAEPNKDATESMGEVST